MVFRALATFEFASEGRMIFQLPTKTMDFNHGNKSKIIQQNIFLSSKKSSCPCGIHLQTRTSLGTIFSPSHFFFNGPPAPRSWQSWIDHMWNRQVSQCISIIPWTDPRDWYICRSINFRKSLDQLYSRVNIPDSSHGSVMGNCIWERAHHIYTYTSSSKTSSNQSYF